VQPVKQHRATFVRRSTPFHLTARFTVKAEYSGNLTSCTSTVEESTRKEIDAPNSRKSNESNEKCDARHFLRARIPWFMPFSLLCHSGKQIGR
jgi:hypothetical protein